VFDTVDFSVYISACVYVCSHNSEAVTGKPLPAVTSSNTDHGEVTCRPPQFGRRRVSVEMQRPDFFAAAANYESTSV